MGMTNSVHIQRLLHVFRNNALMIQKANDLLHRAQNYDCTQSTSAAPTKAMTPTTGIPRVTAAPVKVAGEDPNVFDEGLTEAPVPLGLAPLGMIPVGPDAVV